MEAMVQTKLESVPAGEYVPTADERVVMYGVDWAGFEALLAVRGDRSRPRMAYLDGAVEIMSPAAEHERIEAHIARFVEQYFFLVGIPFTYLGSWLIRRRKEKAGVEPDGCYVFGRKRKTRPDLALEVVWTSGGINKLEIYRRLQVPEVWFWMKGQIHVFELTATGYERREKSVHVPVIDLDLVCKLLKIPVTSDALAALRKELAKRK
jgi:Uma2 family endonuclease